MDTGAEPLKKIRPDLLLLPLVLVLLSLVPLLLLPLLMLLHFNGSIKRTHMS